MFHIFDIDVLTSESNWTGIVAIMVLYGASMSSFCYCLSFFFKSHSYAQNFVIFFSFLTGFIMALASITMFIIPTTRDLNNTLLTFYRLLPGFNLGHGLLAVNFAGFFTLVNYQIDVEYAETNNMTVPDYPEEVSERALMKTSILAMDLAKWLQT